MSDEVQGLVTVLITNFNYGIFIEDAVKSSVAQTYSPLELIIFDDGSTDNSREVIKDLKARYEDRFEGLRTYYFEHLGINGVLNRGIPLINGKITIILDADDKLFPSYTDRTTQVLVENRSKDVGFVYSNSVLIDEHGNEIGVGHSTEFDPELLRHKSYIPGCGATLTEALNKTLPLDEKIKVGTKVHRWRKIADNKFKGLHIPESLFFYRMHKNNISGIGKRLLVDVLNGARNPLLSAYWQS